MKSRASIATSVLVLACLARGALAVERCEPLDVRIPDESGVVPFETPRDTLAPALRSTRAPRFPGSAPNPNAWEAFTPFPIGFSCPTMILDPARDRLVVFAGTGWNGPSDDVFVRPAARSGAWEKLEANGPRPSAQMGGGAFYDPIRDRMVVFGGATSLGVWALSLAGAPTWTRLDDGSPGPPDRIGAGVIHDPIGDRLVMFGGGSPSATYQDVWSFALGDAGGWSQLAPQGVPPTPRAWASVVLDSRRNRMLVFAGEWTLAENADLWSLTLDAAPRWERLDTGGDLPPLVRQSAAAYDAANDRLVVHGGWNPTRYELDDLWVLPLDGPLEWQRVVLDLRPPLRACGQMVHDVARGRMVLFGGIVPDLWALESGASMRWTNWDPGEPNPGFPRYAAAAAWDPVRNKALLFAGQSAARVHGPRRWYIAELREWWVDRYSHWDTPTHGDAPIRGPAALVVDPVRERLLSFGGFATEFGNEAWPLGAKLMSCALRDGAPWEELTPVGEVPRARRNAAMVVDPVRRRAILFGGRDLALLGDTWVLDLDGPPHWERVDSMQPAPEPRIGHAMVHDPIGDRVLLFGGQGESGALSDAWQLSLEPPFRWSPVSTARLPAPRGFPSLVLDTRRNRLVLFGGRDGGGLAHGDTWFLPLAPDAAWSLAVGEQDGPEARWAAAAVYDPNRDRMDIVYGTRDPCGEFADWQLPTGASLRSDDPPAPSVESIGVHAVPGRVSLQWRVVPAAVVRATLQRRDPIGDWQTRATAFSAADGRVTFDDLDASARSLADYRVVVSDGRFAAASSALAVQVPSAAFALRSFGAQPSADGVVVELALPDATATRVELLDISGRRITQREVGGMGPGDHPVRLAARGELSPGLYLVRLLRAGESRVTRVAVIH